MGRPLGASTRVPEPCTLRTRPRLARRLIASRTTLRLTPSWSLRLRSEGNWSPGASLPERICCSKCVTSSLTRSPPATEGSFASCLLPVRWTSYHKSPHDDMLLTPEERPCLEP